MLKYQKEKTTNIVTATARLIGVVFIIVLLFDKGNGCTPYISRLPEIRYRGGACEKEMTKHVTGFFKCAFRATYPLVTCNYIGNPPSSGPVKFLRANNMMVQYDTFQRLEQHGNLSSLTGFEMKSSQLTKFNFGYLGSNIKYINLKGNLLTLFNPQDIHNLTTLTVLVLGFNKIATVTHSTNLVNTNLRWLDLSNNLLTQSLDLSSFSVLTNRLLLDVQNNWGIESILPGSITKLLLDISNTAIKTLDLAVFEKVFALFVVNHNSSVSNLTFTGYKTSFVGEIWQIWLPQCKVRELDLDSVFQIRCITLRLKFDDSLLSNMTEPINREIGAKQIRLDIYRTAISQVFHAHWLHYFVNVNIFFQLQGVNHLLSTEDTNGPLVETSFGSFTIQFDESAFLNYLDWNIFTLIPQTLRLIRGQISSFIPIQSHKMQGLTNLAIVYNPIKLLNLSVYDATIFPSLKSADFSQNQVNQVVIEMGGKWIIDHLNLQQNKLVSVDLDMFTSMSELVILNLHYNQLEYVKLTEHFTKLQVLTLTRNKLTKIPPVCELYFQTLPREGFSYEFNKNPIVCNKDLFWLKNCPYTIFHDNPTCTGPEHIQGRRLNQVTISQMMYKPLQIFPSHERKEANFSDAIIDGLNQTCISLQNNLVNGTIVIRWKSSYTLIGCHVGVVLKLLQNGADVKQQQITVLMKEDVHVDSEYYWECPADHRSCDQIAMTSINDTQVYMFACPREIVCQYAHLVFLEITNMTLCELFIY